MFRFGNFLRTLQWSKVSLNHSGVAGTLFSGNGGKEADLVTAAPPGGWPKGGVWETADQKLEDFYEAVFDAFKTKRYHSENVK